ncbi:MAG TPA: glycosyl hydrolase family 18 protein [Armatimonadota bacterium]|nr:glycosyl hydrolase family 18 protein [Armatimonadota bacterium]
MTARRPRLRRVLVALFLALALLLALDYALYPALSSVGGPSGDHARNGLWLRYAWYLGRHPDSEIRLLARRLRREHIRYAYFHVRHVTADGRLRYRSPGTARRLLRLLRAEAPEVRAVAWIYAGNNGMGGLPVVRLEDPAVRRRMAAEAAWLVRECGFDGVQWDYEVCRDGDPHLLSLLQETRRALDAAVPGRNTTALLAVSTPMWVPRPFRRWGWSEGYFARVAAECDQIAVMAYDSGLYLPRAYAWLVRQQAEHVPRAAALSNPGCGVLIGVPTYARGGLSHHAHAENVEVALKAVRSGLPAGGGVQGVALFADYTTQPDEWAAYRRLWLRP